MDRPVLIVGERGTGKELAVRRLHYLSGRWQGPLVALNCAALAPSVLESELFGHEAGAFTGAQRRRVGRFEAADGGTLFLDEIGLIPLTVQEKILRAVEYGEFERVGGSASVRVNTRILGATNADLAALTAGGQFKADLLDRLSFEVLYVPPLRVRVEDIGLLARHFAARMAMELGWKEVPEITDGAMEELEAYGWPGNIRELKNVVERAVYASAKRPIRRVRFQPFRSPYPSLEEGAGARGAAGAKAVASAVPAVAGPQTPGELNGGTWRPGQSLAEWLNGQERAALLLACAQCGWHQGEAAKLLGLSYDQLRRLLRKHRIRRGNGDGIGQTGR